MPINCRVEGHANLDNLFHYTNGLRYFATTLSPGVSTMLLKLFNEKNRSFQIILAKMVPKIFILLKFCKSHMIKIIICYY